MAKYIITDIHGRDNMQVEIIDSRVIAVENLKGDDTTVPTPELLQETLEMYMTNSRATLESALNSFKPAYAQIKKVDD